MTHRLLVLAVIAGVMAAPSAIPARTTATSPQVCPFTGTPFIAIVEKSGTRVCTRLDLKPVGYLGAPPLVPVCPDDGFVLYKPSFSDGEIAQLRPWVESDVFRTLARDESTYFRIARTQEKLSAPAPEVALSYVAASWQVEADPKRYRRYVLQAIAVLDPYIANPPTGAASSHLPTAEATLLSADLKRRLGQFDDARQRLGTLKGTDDVQLAELVEFELALVEAGDSKPHYFPRGEDPRCAVLDRQQLAAPEPAPQGELPTPVPMPTAGALGADKLRP
jgi:hypothetical protein